MNILWQLLLSRQKRVRCSFGAVIVKDGIIAGKGYTKDRTTGEVTQHAEIEALRAACREVQSNNLENCTIYCTNEPCLMCAACIFQAKIAQVIIGASRNDLSHLLRPRNIHIDLLVEDSGQKKALELFQDVKKI